MSRCNADRTFRVSQIVGLLIKADLFFLLKLICIEVVSESLFLQQAAKNNKKEHFWLERMSQHILHFNPGKAGKESGERECVFERERDCKEGCKQLSASQSEKAQMRNKKREREMKDVKKSDKTEDIERKEERERRREKVGEKRPNFLSFFTKSV